MNDAQLVERLAGTDAFAADVPLPDEIWTSVVALREIERRTGMQTRERTIVEQASGPGGGRRRWLIPALAGGIAVILAVVVAVVLLSGGDEETPDVGNTTVPTTVPEAATLTPLEVGEALNQAAITGDPVGAGMLYADEATYTGFVFLTEQVDEPLKAPLEFPDPKDVDWDGDGFITLLDVEIAWMMEAYAAGTTTYQACTEVDPATVRCQLVFEGFGFLDEPVDQWNIFRVEDGLVIHQEFGFESSDGLFAGPQRRNYHDWVRANRPELEDELFRNWGSPIITPQTVETHHELVAQWRVQS